MMKESLKHLLAERRIATLTTFSPDGLPHVTAVWFLHEEGALYIATGSRTGKGRNLQQDSRLAVCIESREPGREAGLSACGHAELLTGEEAAPYALRVNAKYLTDAALQHPKIRPFFVEMSDLVIRLKPERWISWDMAELGEQLFGAEADVDESEFFRPVLP